MVAGLQELLLLQYFFQLFYLSLLHCGWSEYPCWWEVEVRVPLQRFAAGSAQEVPNILQPLIRWNAGWCVSAS